MFDLSCRTVSLMFFTSSPLRRRGQYRGEDASPGVCPQQEEGPGAAEPQPGRPTQRRSLLVQVSHHGGGGEEECGSSSSLWC